MTDAVSFPHLFSPFALRGIELRNRIVSTAHGTTTSVRGLPTEATAAYHRARAKGGVGLIVLEAAAVHETAVYNEAFLTCDSDAAVPGFKRIAEQVHAHGAKVFGQLYHPGASMRGHVDGLRLVPVAPSFGIAETSRMACVAMTPALIDKVIRAYGETAQRMISAGMDGLEINSRNGNLPAQFLNPRINGRTDGYGGGFDNRIRFLVEIIEEIRGKLDSDVPLGLRVSGEPMDDSGLASEEVIEACKALAPSIDYFNVIAGSVSSYAGLSHIVPPMGIGNGYMAAKAAVLRSATGRPVLVAGRITRPELAERLIVEGQADLCGMTRALIADPEMPNKARTGRTDEIRECIGCNQACIGHEPLAVPLSCIQYPETGRELSLGPRRRVQHSRRVIVVGGGPAGLKAAAVAAERGHRVTLFEQARQFGGQAQTAALIPGRSEFGGLVSNLLREARSSGAELVTGHAVDGQLIRGEAPDAVILATGALPPRREIDGAEEMPIFEAGDLLQDKGQAGSAVVIADERCDWIGMGIAEKLVREGRWVRLCVMGHSAGQELESMSRYRWLGILDKLGVEIIPHLRLAGLAGNAVYFQHLASLRAVACENADTLVLACAYQPLIALQDELVAYEGEVHINWRLSRASHG
jgi:2,4-dienoyl-CoA reductase-like NADH-dependent reductase (Old Yellow Enzyme family)